MSRITKFFILLIVGIFFLSLFQNKILLSSDILQTIPQFAEEKGWERPGNSLLSDPVFQFETWRIYAKERLLKFEFPFINSQNSLGVPFFANQISAIFFPLNLIYYFLPVAGSLFLIHALKFYFLLLFTYLYFRSLRIEKFIALSGGLFACCLGFSIVWLQWPQTNAFLIFPLLLYLTERIKETNGKTVFKIAISFAYLLLVLAGHPETAFHIVLLHFLYIFFRVRPLRQVLETIGFSIIGIGLGAFSILPFLEYLLASYALAFRSTEAPIALPVYSLIFQIFPFLFGAPILDFYKPISSNLNFQELMGGYVGLSLLILGLVASIKLAKSSLKYFWVFSLALCFFTAYGIFPFSIINSLPVLSVSANHRLVGFGGFSLIVLSVIYVNNRFREVWRNTSTKKLFIVIVFIISLITIIFFTPVNILTSSIKYEEFANLLKSHVYFILVTTAIFFLSLHYFFKRKKRFYFYLCTTIVALQSLGILISYNSLTLTSQYYPQTRLTHSLSRYSPGLYLEVGNSSLTENLNLAYGYSSLENYDAIDIATFKKEYDNSFPIKNQWGNPDAVTKKSLSEFGVSYIISDYDLRLKKIDIQPRRNKILEPLLKSNPILISLPSEKISSVRMLPATFNRVNSCNVYFTFLDAQSNEISKQKILCDELYNNMYFSQNVPTVNDSKYLIISTDTENIDNSISFYGDGSKPYISYLTESAKSLGLTLLDSGKTWFLFYNPDAKFIQTSGVVSELSSKDERISFIVDQRSPEKIKVMRSFFPGWTVSVDGEPAKLLDKTFLSVEIPSGVHFVDFVYTPYSFYSGLVISIFSLSVLLVYLIRSVRRSKNQLYGKSLNEFSKKVKTVTWVEHFIIFLIFLAVSAATFVLIVRSISPVFMMPSTTAINWFTVHNYPRQQDYFYFISGFVFVTLVSLTLWAVVIWKKVK